MTSEVKSVCSLLVFVCLMCFYSVFLLVLNEAQFGGEGVCAVAVLSRFHTLIWT